MIEHPQSLLGAGEYQPRLTFDHVPAQQSSSLLENIPPSTVRGRSRTAQLVALKNFLTRSADLSGEIRERGQYQDVVLAHNIRSSESNFEVSLGNYAPESPTEDNSTRYKQSASSVKSTFSQKMRSGRISNPTRKAQELKEAGVWVKSLTGTGGLVRRTRKWRGSKKTKTPKKVLLLNLVDSLCVLTPD